MHTTNLRKVGGSVMLAVPPAILDLLQLVPGTTVGLVIEHGRLVVDPRPKPRYTLAELLAACDGTAPIDAQDQAWLDDNPIGSELI
ncbi:MAG TPA: antitoxin [Eoetvoesiella sp.]